jgi:angio-associated migratory cell protein
MDGSIWLWNADRLKFMQSFFGHHAPVSCCGFWSSGKMVFSGGEDGEIRTWNPKTAECTGKMSSEDKGGVLVMQLSSTKDFLVYAGHADGTVQLINLETCKVIKEMHHKDSIECIAQSKRHPYVATGSMDSGLTIWDTRSGDFRVMCKHGDETGVVKAVWHPVDPFLFTGSTDGLVRKWDARTGECVAIWRGHSDMILDLRISTYGFYCFVSQSPLFLTDRLIEWMD